MKKVRLVGLSEPLCVSIHLRQNITFLSLKLFPCKHLTYVSGYQRASSRSLIFPVSK